MKLLITGCGLSGTHYTMKVLRRCEVDVGHEKVCAQGAVSWLHATWPEQKCWDKQLTCGDPAWTGGNIRRPSGGSVNTFDHVVRQVRNPRKIATSYAKDAHGASWRFARTVIEGVFGVDFPWPPADDLVAAGVCYTWWWLTLAGMHSEFTYRVEDMPTVLPKLLSWFGRDPQDDSYKSALEVDKKTASRQKKRGYDYWTWDRIEQVPWGRELHAFAQQMGYN